MAVGLFEETFTYIQSRNKFRSLYRYLKKYSGYMEHKERFQLVFQQIDKITDCFCLKPIGINSQAKAERIIMKIIEEHYDMMKAMVMTKSKLKWLQSLTDDSLYMINSYDPFIASSKRSDSLIKSLFSLIDDKYDISGKYENEAYERFLCPVCVKKHNIVFSVTSGDFCPQCQYRELQYKKEKEIKRFSSIHLEHKIVMSYTYLWAYIMSFDLKTAHNYFERLREYSLFLNRAISILLYEKERLKYGYGYNKKYAK